MFACQPLGGSWRCAAAPRGSAQDQREATAPIVPRPSGPAGANSRCLRCPRCSPQVPPRSPGDQAGAARRRGAAVLGAGALRTERLAAGAHASRAPLCTLRAVARGTLPPGHCPACARPPAGRRCQDLSTLLRTSIPSCLARRA
jgi:hypothetical protein